MDPSHDLCSNAVGRHEERQSHYIMLRDKIALRDSKPCEDAGGTLFFTDGEGQKSRSHSFVSVVNWSALTLSDRYIANRDLVSVLRSQDDGLSHDKTREA